MNKIIISGLLIVVAITSFFAIGFSGGFAIETSYWNCYTIGSDNKFCTVLGDPTYLKSEIKQLDVNLQSYIGEGCLQMTRVNPYGEGKTIQSQGFASGKLWNHVNGTLHTQTYCSVTVWDAFEDTNRIWLINNTKGDVHYDGEWIRWGIGD